MIQKLPLLVLLKILDYLPTLDAIRCRAVCKSWQRLIDQFVLDELNVFLEKRQYTMYLQLQNCFTNLNRSISFGWPPYNRMVVNNEQFHRLFRNLRKFAYQTHYKLCSDDFQKVEKLINSFKNLEHLYLAGIPLLSIKLEKLKTYDCSYSKEAWAGGGQVKKQEVVKLLDCPELQALAIDYQMTEEPILNCPKLRYLKYDDYSSWISRLDSLEVLNLWWLKTNPADTLSNHPKLHTLNVFRFEKAVLEELFRSKRELGREHLKIFAQSLPVDGEVLKAFDQILDKEETSLGFFTAKGVELYAKREQEFRDDFFVFHEHQGIFIEDQTFANLKLLTDRTSILRKIRFIHTLCVKGGWYSQDKSLNRGESFSQDQLIGLIKEIPNLHRFACYCLVLNQAFFDQLPTILPFLRDLNILSESIDLNDLSFVLRFRELCVFRFIVHEYSDEDERILAEFRKKNALDFDDSNGHCIQQ